MNATFRPIPAPLVEWITAAEAIKLLKKPGPAYVFTRLTEHDGYYVEVKKAHLIEILSKMDPKTIVEDFNIEFPG